MLYLTLKLVHVGCAIASISGFTLRGILMLLDSPLLATRFARIAPHVVDTVLLASALWLAALTRDPLGFLAGAQATSTSTPSAPTASSIQVAEVPTTRA